MQGLLSIFQTVKPLNFISEIHVFITNHSTRDCYTIIQHRKCTHQVLHERYTSYRTARLLFLEKPTSAQLSQSYICLNQVLGANMILVYQSKPPHICGSVQDFLEWIYGIGRWGVLHKCFSKFSGTIFPTTFALYSIWSFIDVCTCGRFPGLCTSALSNPYICTWCRCQTKVKFRREVCY